MNLDDNKLISNMGINAPISTDDESVNIRSISSNGARAHHLPQRQLMRLHQLGLDMAVAMALCTTGVLQNIGPPVTNAIRLALAPVREPPP